MELIALVSFGMLISAWVALPVRTPKITVVREEEEAA
jgi:hypothetical protein